MQRTSYLSAKALFFCARKTNSLLPLLTLLNYSSRMISFFIGSFCSLYIIRYKKIYLLAPPSNSSAIFFFQIKLYNFILL